MKTNMVYLQIRVFGRGRRRVGEVGGKGKGREVGGPGFSLLTQDKREI